MMNEQPDQYVDVEGFKKWMEDHKNDHTSAMKRKPNNNLIGTIVESKINIKKLLNKMNVEIDVKDDEIESIAKDFIEQGGKIIESLDNHFIIETTKGSFSIHRCYVCRA